MPMHDSSLLLVFCQKLVHCRYLVVKALLLVGSTADADIALNAHYSIRMQHCVTLTDYAHAFFPCALYIHR